MWNFWKKKPAKEGVEKTVEKEETVLENVCGGDEELYGFASGYLCVNPIVSVSSKTLEVLMEEAAESGDYRPALDKALFEASKKPEQKQNYEAIIQDITAKTIATTEKEIAKVEKQGLMDRASFLRKRIEEQQTLQKRAGDIIDTAARYYGERVLELKEDERKAERIAHRREVESEKWNEGLAEQTKREERKNELKGMGRAERKQAELADAEKIKANEEATRKAELEDQRLEEREETAREERIEHLKKQ